MGSEALTAAVRQAEEKRDRQTAPQLEAGKRRDRVDERAVPDDAQAELAGQQL